MSPGTYESDTFPLLNSTAQTAIEIENENKERTGLVRSQQVSHTLSVIIPVFNEEARISSLLSRIKKVLNEALLNFELIVINDGSNDSTERVILKEEKSDRRIRVLSYKENKGKGHAVKMGILNSSGDVVCFLDGDLEISPYELNNYIKELQGCDLVIASKTHPLSVVTLPRVRKILSRVFSIFARLVVGMNIKDTQSGLKVGNGNALRKIFNVMVVKRYAFDVEMLAIASRLNLKIKEYPVRIVSREKSFKPREMFKMFVDVLGIAYRLRIIHYYQKLWK